MPSGWKPSGSWMVSGRLRCWWAERAGAATAVVAPRPTRAVIVSSRSRRRQGRKGHHLTISKGPAPPSLLTRLLIAQPLIAARPPLRRSWVTVVRDERDGQERRSGWGPGRGGDSDEASTTFASRCRTRGRLACGASDGR